MVRRERNDQGFTVLEILIAVAIGTIILLGLYALLETGQSTTSRGEQKLEIQQAARAGLDTMVRDLRMAGSGVPNPQDYANPPAAFTAGTADSISFLADPLNANTVLTANAPPGTTVISLDSTTSFAAGGTIYIFGNDGASPPANCWETRVIASKTGTSLTLDAGLSNSYIAGSQVAQPRTYAYDLQGTTLRRDAGDGNGAQPLAENISAMTIRYYDTADAEISPLSLPAHLHDIRRLEIRITAFKNNPLQGDQTFLLNSSVRPRNI
jgi:prepilin-type N-terminal cleavage/methylation domain-containing protein